MRYLIKLKKLLDIQSYRRLHQHIKGYEKAISIITLLRIVGSFTGVLTAIVTKLLIDSATNRLADKIVVFSLALASLLVFELVNESVTRYFSIKTVEELRNSLQLRLLKTIFNKKWLNINKYKSGDLLTRLHSDIGNIVNVSTDILPSLLALVFQVTLAFAFLAFYDPFLAVIAILIMPVTILFGMIIGRALRKVTMLIQETEGMQQAMMNESIHNLLILKVFGYYKTNARQIEIVQKEKLGLIQSRNIISIKANILMNIGYVFGFFASLVIGSYRLYKRTITFGTLAAFLQLVGQVQGPIQEMARKIPQLVSSFSSLERIQEIYNLPEDMESDKIIDAQPKTLNLEGVTFCYNEDSYVFKDYSLKITIGEKIAIVGQSGKGKTTLLHIILSLIDPIEGKVFFEMSDGTQLNSCPDTRRFFSYVPQSSLMFSGTIKDNLLVDETMNEDKIDEVLRIACAKEFVDALPLGINTMLEEGGTGLSQGQAQRLTIARALLHDTEIIIFDEATSALDSNTELMLINNLKEAYPNRTLIAVTHRELIFDICDRVIRL